MVIDSVCLCVNACSKEKHTSKNIFFVFLSVHLSSLWLRLWLCLWKYMRFFTACSFIKLALHASRTVIRSSGRKVFACHSHIHIIKSVGRSVCRFSWYNSDFEWFVTQSSYNRCRAINSFYCFRLLSERKKQQKQ